MHSGIYIGWTGRQNLGDEALWEICKSRFSNLDWTIFESWYAVPTPSRFITHARLGPRRLLRSFIDELQQGRHTRALGSELARRLFKSHSGVVGMLGGGTLITSVYLHAYISVRQHTRRPVPVFGTGVNSPDLFSRMPDWKDSRKEWVSYFSELPVVGVRGPMSRDLLTEAGASNIIESGDPSVLFHSPQSGSATFRTDCGRRVGINCGISKLGWGNWEHVNEELASLAQWLQRNGDSVELLAVWPEDLQSCYDVARRAQLPASSVQPVLSSPSEYLKKMKRLDFLVALKLHAGILAAAENVPFIMLEYQPKCRDFTRSIGWEEFTIRTDALRRNLLQDTLTAMFGQKSALETRLCASMCVLRKKFENYSELLANMLAGNEMN